MEKVTEKIVEGLISQREDLLMEMRTIPAAEFAQSDARAQFLRSEIFTIDTMMNQAMDRLRDHEADQ